MVVVSGGGGGKQAWGSNDGTDSYLTVHAEIGARLAAELVGRALDALCLPRGDLKVPGGTQFALGGAHLSLELTRLCRCT